MKRGQIATEFIILLGMAMIIMIIFISFLNMLLANKNEEMRDELFNDLGESLQYELLFTYTLQDGYTRTIYVPPMHMNTSYERYNYSINASNGQLTIFQDDRRYSFSIPDIIGDITIGKNTLTKSGGMIYVTQ